MVVIGVIGTGYWGKNHVRTFCTLKEEGLIDKVIVCDSDESRAIEIGEELVSVNNYYLILQRMFKT